MDFCLSLLDLLMKVVYSLLFYCYCDAVCLILTWHMFFMNFGNGCYCFISVLGVIKTKTCFLNLNFIFLKWPLTTSKCAFAPLSGSPSLCWYGMQLPWISSFVLFTSSASETHHGTLLLGVRGEGFGHFAAHRGSWNFSAVTFQKLELNYDFTLLQKGTSTSSESTIRSHVGISQPFSIWGHFTKQFSAQLPPCVRDFLCRYH